MSGDKELDGEKESIDKYIEWYASYLAHWLLRGPPAPDRYDRERNRESRNIKMGK